jgi:hypothetical protein
MNPEPYQDFICDSSFWNESKDNPPPAALREAT